jgi:PAS domain S-box-containing protein
MTAAMVTAVTPTAPMRPVAPLADAVAHGEAAQPRRHRLVRRWDDLPLRSKGMAVIAIPVVPLILSAILFLGSGRSARSAQEWVSHTLEVKGAIATVLSLMVDAESGVRGFLLTRDADALVPFTNATAVLPYETERLRTLTADNQAQREHLQTLAALMAARPLTRVLDYSHERPGAGPPLALLAESRSTMGAIRTELAQMQLVEDVLLARRVDAVRRADRRLVFVSVIAVLLGLSGGTAATRAFTAGVSRRIDRLAESASRLAAGDALLPLVEARDEVGAVDRRLHETAGLLRRRDDQLQQHVRDQAALNADLELARKELDQFFSLSLDVMGIAGTDGRFNRVNRSWERTLGWTEAEMTSVPFLDLVHPDDREATAAEAAKLVAGRATVSFENRYRARNGSYRWLNWSAVSTPERGLLYCAARDVTDQKRAAADLERRAAELAMVNDELEAFSYSVSHDLRAPLRHVTGFASLLKRSAIGRLNDTEARHLQTIVDAAARMDRLIDDLLAFSRMGRAALAPQHVSLDALVRDAQQDLHAAPDQSVVWTIHPLPEVDGDPAMLRLVLVNLLSNALKYSAARAIATIEVGVQPGAADETIVYVRDNGAGFDMQYAHKLFGVFQRLHSAEEFEGTGIGLANVRRIINRHGGRTWAEGVVGEGATFYFTLPIAATRLEARSA